MPHGIEDSAAAAAIQASLYGYFCSSFSWQFSLSSHRASLPVVEEAAAVEVVRLVINLQFHKVVDQLQPNLPDKHAIPKVMSVVEMYRLNE